MRMRDIQGPNLRVGSGFSLIEVLITLLILSIGLVGMAALQLTAVRNVHSSLLTTTAVAAALDFEELAWVRLATLESGCVSFDEPFRDAFVGRWGAAQGQVGLPGLVAVASHTDLHNWRDFNLTLSWLEGRFEEQVEGGSETRESFVFSVRVPCVSED